MLAKDRVFWKNVSESLGQKSKFDEELRELLGKRVEEFNSDSDNLENTEKEIRIYCEVIGAIMALKKAAEVAFESDCKKISAQVLCRKNGQKKYGKGYIHTSIAEESNMNLMKRVKKSFFSVTRSLKITWEMTSIIWTNMAILFLKKMGVCRARTVWSVWARKIAQKGKYIQKTVSGRKLKQNSFLLHCLRVI